MWILVFDEISENRLKDENVKTFQRTLEVLGFEKFETHVHGLYLSDEQDAAKLTKEIYANLPTGCGRVQVKTRIVRVPIDVMARSGSRQVAAKVRCDIDAQSQVREV